MTKTERQRILEHLAAYKESVLGINESGSWDNTQYRQILPESQASRNLIDASYLEPIQQAVATAEGRVHRGFAHLNSSQALAFNLFVPLSSANRLDLVLNLLGKQDTDLSGVPEYIEDETEGTNFDYFIQGKDKKFFFEVKYTEDRFASTNDDKSHRKKFEQVYEPRLAKIAKVERGEFFRDYQLWRNIIYIDRGIVMFVIPRFRKDLQKTVERARDMTLFPEKVKVLFVDDVVERAIDLGQPELRKHFQEFQRKYLGADSEKELP
jgi:hypothetical protein